jgi:hypothetical protein
MNIQNLNSIEGVMDEIINLTKEKEEMSISEWSPILKQEYNFFNELFELANNKMNFINFINNLSESQYFDDICIEFKRSLINVFSIQ